MWLQILRLQLEVLSATSLLSICLQGFLVAQTVKNPPAGWETQVRSLGLGRSPGGGHGYPLQYSCLENAHGQRSLVTVHGVTKSRT